MLCEKSQERVDAPASENSEKIMIENVTLHNFRCFQKMDVAGLKKINLLVGKNSSGKSAFLESLFLSSSSTASNATFQLRAIRRMGNQLVIPSIDSHSYRALWEDLFYDFNQEKRVYIKVEGNPNADSRTLAIEYVDSLATQELPFSKQIPLSSGSLLQNNAMPQIEFKWKRQGYPEVISRPKLTQTGLQAESTTISFFPAIWFTPSGGELPEENARRFSEVEKKGGMDKIKAAIPKEFPYIKDISILYHAGVPMLFADFNRGGKCIKMPVALLSDGINRLLGICLGLAYFAGGLVLIDEVENGFHHTLLPSIWASIYALACDFKVQLFISTHSGECLNAMLPIVKGHEDDFCLLRATRTDGGCNIRALSGDYLESALEQDFEVR